MCEIFSGRNGGLRGTIEANAARRAGDTVSLERNDPPKAEAEPQRRGVDTVCRPCFCEKHVKITGRAGGACPDV